MDSFNKKPLFCVLAVPSRQTALATEVALEGNASVSRDTQERIALQLWPVQMIAQKMEHVLEGCAIVTMDTVMQIALVKCAKTNALVMASVLGLSVVAILDGLVSFVTQKLLVPMIARVHSIFKVKKSLVMECVKMASVRACLVGEEQIAASPSTCARMIAISMVCAIRLESPQRATVIQDGKEPLVLNLCHVQMIAVTVTQFREGFARWENAPVSQAMAAAIVRFL